MKLRFIYTVDSVGITPERHSLERERDNSRRPKIIIAKNGNKFVNIEDEIWVN